MQCRTLFERLKLKILSKEVRIEDKSLKRGQTIQHELYFEVDKLVRRKF